MLSVKINNTVIDRYLDKFQVDIKKRYADGVNYKTISGKEIKHFLGYQRQISIDFEPMENSQIQELFSAICEDSNEINIQYDDPKNGRITKKFVCNNLPASTYFISDDGRKFWMIPTVVFEETGWEDSEDSG